MRSDSRPSRSTRPSIGPTAPSTYARWAAETPEGFAFAVKVPKEITHTRRLVDAAEPLDRFLAETAALGPKRGPLLVQLPPSLAYDAEVVGSFLSVLRRRYDGGVACEPRHPSWFAAEVDRELSDHDVARVAADPAVVPPAAEPGGWGGLVYYRLHGSPQMYYSAYPAGYLEALATRLAEAAVPPRPGASSTTRRSGPRRPTRSPCWIGSGSPAGPNDEPRAHQEL